MVKSTLPALLYILYREGVLTGRDKFLEPEIFYSSPLTGESGRLPRLQEGLDNQTSRHYGLAGKMIPVDPVFRIKVKSALDGHLI